MRVLTCPHQQRGQGGQPSRSRLCSWLGPLHCYTISSTDFSTPALPAAPQSQGGGGISQGRKNKWLSRGLAVGGGREGRPHKESSREFVTWCLGLTCVEGRTGGSWLLQVHASAASPSGSAGSFLQDVSGMWKMALGEESSGESLSKEVSARSESLTSSSALFLQGLIPLGYWEVCLAAPHPPHFYFPLPWNLDTEQATASPLTGRDPAALSSQLPNSTPNRFSDA